MKGGLKERKLVKRDVNDKSLVLTNTNSKLYAMDAVCSREGGPLEEGTVEENTKVNLICVQLKHLHLIYVQPVIV
jgi:nitrite reductase/ring-hydroxylating ferredoxin subunit